MPYFLEGGVRPHIECVAATAHDRTWVYQRVKTAARFVGWVCAANAYVCFIDPGVSLDVDVDRRQRIPALVVAGGVSLCPAELRTANRAYNMSRAGDVRLLGIADQRLDRLYPTVRGRS